MVPITPRTSLQLATISRQFKAALALLILDDELSMETPVPAFFREVDRYEADLCIERAIYFTELSRSTPRRSAKMATKKMSNELMKCHTISPEPTQRN